MDCYILFGQKFGIWNGLKPRIFLIANSFVYLTFCLGLLGMNSLKGENYEGVSLFQSEGKIGVEWLYILLPYNPIVIEAGAFLGEETERMAKQWPHGRIISLEPNPEAFEALQQKIRMSNVEFQSLALNTYNGAAVLNICHGPKGRDPVYGYASSLLPLTKEMESCCKGPQAEVPCVILDDWCALNQIDHIDLLRLDVEGMALPVLQSSPHILQNTQMIYVKTIIHPHRIGMTQYAELKKFLEQSNFVLLSHWYQPGISGQAVFLSRELFDAFFKLSMGLYLEM